jgi:hypothetical protein
MVVGDDELMMHGLVLDQHRSRSWNTGLEVVRRCPAAPPVMHIPSFPSCPLGDRREVVARAGKLGMLDLDHYE